MDAPSPTERERALAHWHAQGFEQRYALQLACYREELLRPFEAMLEDYEALGDQRVTKQLTHIIQTIRGVP